MANLKMMTNSSEPQKMLITNILKNHNQLLGKKKSKYNVLSISLSDAVHCRPKTIARDENSTAT